MRRKAAIVVVAALAAHGCLLFTDISGLDAEDAVGGSDSGGDSSWTSDAVSDDAAPEDAGVSDALAADAATACKTSDAAFCADFDDGVLMGRWTTVDPSSGGRTVEISNAVSKSPSSSFHSVIDRAVINHAVGDCSYARAKRDLAELGARLRARFSFDAFLGSVSGMAVPEGVLAANLFTNKQCNFIISLEDTTCGALLQFPRDGGSVGAGGSGLLASPIGRKWAHVDLDVSFDPSTPMWTLSINGQRCGEVHAMPPECQSAQTFDVGVGLYCEDKGSGVPEIFIDNVEVR